MTATTPEEVYPPSGYVLLGVHSDELFSTTIYPNRDEALAAARAVSDGWAPAIAPIGKDARTSWDEPLTPEPPKLVWVPNRGGWYSRNTTDTGTYFVEPIPLANGGPLSGYYDGLYQRDGGERESLCLPGSSAESVKKRVEQCNAEAARASAWATYMRDNDPPAVR